MNRDHPDYKIIEISQNTEKNPGDLKRFGVTQDFSERLSANVGMKNSQVIIIMIIIIIIIMIIIIITTTTTTKIINSSVFWLAFCLVK